MKIQHSKPYRDKIRAIIRLKFIATSARIKKKSDILNKLRNNRPSELKKTRIKQSPNYMMKRNNQR